MMKIKRIIMSLLATATAFAVQAQTTPISFEDPEVKRICVENWDTNGDGELSYDEAAAVKSIWTEFNSAKGISTFHEFQYFTGLQELHWANFTNSDLTEITLPANIKYIGYQSIAHCYRLTKVVLPANLETIDNAAFIYNSNLSSITFPAGLKSLYNGAFVGCKSLAEIKIEDGPTNYESPEGSNVLIEKATKTLVLGCKTSVVPSYVEHIAPSAFQEVEYLVHLDLPVGLKTIGAWAFAGCESLENVTLPEELQVIDSMAFYACKSFTSIHIPASVTSIGRGITQVASDKLCSIDVSAGNPVYDSRGNCNAIIETSTNTLIGGCETTIIPLSVTSIGPNGFAQHLGFKEIVVPRQVKSIGKVGYAGCWFVRKLVLHEDIEEIGAEAFANLTSLDSVVSYMPIPIAISANTFINKKNSATLYVPVGTKELYEQTEYWKDFANIVEMVPESEPKTVELMEYFYDTDPGYGKGIITSNVQVGDNTLQLSTEGLQPGAHLLFVRSLDNNGVWSATEAHAFYLASHRSDEIARLEYFFDTDPGFGLGTPVSGELNGERVLALSTDGLLPGSHILCLRSQGKQGEWSSVSISKFYLLSTSSANIRRLEYFFDTDPGHGEGHTLLEIREGEQQVALSTDGLQPGAHLLFMRTQTDDGRWSATEAHPFYVSKTLGTRPTLVEYFFDTDPGYGQGQHVAAQEGEQQLSLSLGDLGYGAHILFTRVSDDQGGWSAVEAHPFFICDREGFVAMEYYFDTDPGHGLGTPVTLPLYFRDSDPLVISASTEGLQPGNHTINLRGMDKEGKWSEVTTRTFRINGAALEMAKAVEYDYNGRYATLTSETEGATIHYTLDGTTPTTSSPVYTDPTDVGGLATLRAIATKEGFDPSEPTQLTVPCYYDGDVAQVGTAGTLAQAFGWCDAQEIERLTVKGNLDDTDYATLRTLQALRHVDLKDVATANQSIPDNALAATHLVTAELPAALTSAGATLFVGCDELAAIGWNADIAVPPVTLQGIDNPNLLLYVGQTEQARQTGIHNIVANGRAEDVKLSDGTGNTNFFALRPFVADRISYAHIYGLETGYDDLYGWETLALPFTVQTITHETRGRLTPFAQATGSRDERPFWLCQLTAGGWQEAPSVAANVPYIVAMPNNEVYSDVYQLAGQVTFAATSADVPATTAQEAQSGNTRFVPTMLSIGASDLVYALNRERYEEYREGSVFVRNLRQVRPFEAYCTNANGGPHLIPIKSDMLTGISEIMRNGENEKMRNEKTSAVYDLSGRRVPVSSVSSARSVLPKGLYIVNGRKVLIK